MINSLNGLCHYVFYSCVKNNFHCNLHGKKETVFNWDKDYQIARIIINKI